MRVKSLSVSRSRLLLLVACQSLLDCGDDNRHGEHLRTHLDITGLHCGNVDPAHDTGDADVGPDILVVRKLYMFILRQRSTLTATQSALLT